MPPSTKKKSHGKPGHAKGRFRRQGLRNAGPAGFRPPPRSRAASTPEPKNEKLIRLLESIAGAAATSYLGAWAVKYGANPTATSVALGVATGALALASNRQLYNQAAQGAASAAGSQFVLLTLAPKPAAPPRVVAVQASPQPPQGPPRKNADLGALPPGMLDAAFENARAQLAVSGDGFPASYQPDFGHHQFHHGPVMP
jgi:hypothetical protein